MRLPFAGIDGCRAGWFCVRLGEGDTWAFDLLEDSASISELARQSGCAFIDIPIGLPGNDAGERQCDREARRLLGPGRAASVFPAPARQTLAAGSYREAVACNRRLTGRGISRQTWGIAPKLREVDRLLRAERSLIGVLRECHPEVALLGLNGGQAMADSKKTAAGREQRLAVLSRFFPAATQLLARATASFLRRQVAIDDIIDAMANAVLARASRGRVRTLPACPPRDAHGIPVEMVYWIAGRDTAAV